MNSGTGVRIGRPAVAAVPSRAGGLSWRDPEVKLGFMSRARLALESLRILHPGREGAPGRPDNVLQWVLSRWADEQRRTELPVVGSSMWPVLRSGEHIVVRHGGRPPVVGEIVVFLQQERTLAHRVIRCRGAGFDFALRAKGDFTLVADPGWLGPERIVGVVEAVLRGGRAFRPFGLGGFPGAAIALLSGLQGALLQPIHRLRMRRARAAGDGA